MASIPLPALDVRPPTAQPDELQQYGRLLQLQNMQQSAPLQRQEMQQNVQAGQLENQQRQIQLKDQQAMTAAMQQWDGKNLDDLPPLILKNGGSATAVMGLKQKALAMKQQYATIAKDDATTGAQNLETMKGKNDLIAGALSPLLDPQQTPDAQLPQAVTATAQDLVQKGLLDPQHAQVANQIAQSGNPAQIRQQLTTLQKSYMAQSQIMAQAKDQATIGEQNANAASKTAELNYYQTHGGAPGVAAEIQQQNDWLAKNPGKGASDYKLWTLQHTPSAMIMGNMLGGQQNADALDFAANNYRLTGQMPSGLYRSPGTTEAIIARAAAMDKESGGAGIAGNKSILDANRKSLDNVQKQFDTVNAFENTAGKNIDMALQKAAAIPDLGARFANTPIRLVNEKTLGTREMAEFRAALATAQAESAKVLNSANASGVLSDTARKELEDITSGNLSLNAMRGQWGVIKQDMQNRHDSYQQQIGDIQGRIRNAGNATPSTSGPKVGDTKTFPNGKVGKWDGTGWVAQ